MYGRPAEEAGTQLRVPADTVPLAHLILEKPCQQQALRACHFHHDAVPQQRAVRHEMVEDLTEVSGSWPFDVGLRRYLRVVRQYAGVVQQFVLIDVGLGHIPKAGYEELQGARTVGRQQFSQWTHTEDQGNMNAKAGMRRIKKILRKIVDRAAKLFRREATQEPGGDLFCQRPGRLAEIEDTQAAGAGERADT